MKILIFEDEDLVAKRLIKLLSRIDFEFELLGTIRKVTDGIKWFDENEMPDLIFADIQLLDGTSFMIFDKVDISSYVIFTTSYDEYAIQAFRVNSVDYLLKPILEEDLCNAIAKINKLESQKKLNLSTLLSQLSNKGTEYRSRFLVKVGTEYKIIDASEISYFYINLGVTYIVGFKGNKYSLDITLDEIEITLDPKVYFRINRKLILSIKSINKIKTYFNSRLLLEINPEFYEDVIVSRSRVKEFKSWLDH